MEKIVSSNIHSAFLRENIEYGRHREKIEEEFFYEKFNPIEDYNWHFLFHDLLVITNVVLDEAIGAVNVLTNRNNKHIQNK